MTKRFSFGCSRITVLLLLFAVSLLSFGRTINVRGIVTIAGSKEPIQGVTIRNVATERLIGTTNMEGRFTVSIDDSGTLLFSIMGYEDATIQVDGQMTIDVSLFPKAHELEEVVVVAKSLSNVMTIDPAELDVKGNYVYLKKRVRIPHKIFSPDVRMIIQPTIYDVTRRHLSYLTPVVFDGRRYDITQTRMYDWKPELDPLHQYQEVKRTNHKTDDIVTIEDSLYTDNPKNDFMCIVMTSLENYNRIVYADTFLIARGTINPLRFLKYDLDGYELTDEQYLPQPEVHLRDTKGDMHLAFGVGESKLDLTLGNNNAEIESMLDEFRTIENDPDMTLKSFKISGTSSPEGRYERNLQLAKARMESAMNVIVAAVPEGLRRNATMSTDAAVASWADVETLLRKDGHTEEADEIRRIIDATPSSIDVQSGKIRRLPFYKSLLVNEYLPRLRRVSYEIVYSRYRPLNDEEIEALYIADSSSLSKYNFWRYYKNAANDEKRESIMRRALEVHPDFLAAATDLSALLINQDRAEEEVLAPFFTDVTMWLKMPEVSRYNMAVSAMNFSHYSKADSLLVDLPDTEDFHKAKAYCSAMNGRYVDVMQEISEDSPINEVVLLLAMKDNDTALERANKLGNSAVEEYIKAVAANRKDLYVEALVHLEHALALDPSLRDVARVDGDVAELLQDIEESDEEENNDNATNDDNL